MLGDLALVAAAPVVHCGQVRSAQCGNEAKRAGGILTPLAAAALVALAVATVGARSGLGHVIVERPDLTRVEAALTRRIAGIICASSPADVGILRVFLALRVRFAGRGTAPPDDVATRVTIEGTAAEGSPVVLSFK